VPQIPSRFQAVIDEQVNLYGQKRSIEIRNSIPDTTTIPIGNPTHWYKIIDVISVFVDMKGSTKLSASLHDLSTAGAYQLFTGTAVQIFHTFEAPYIDVRGDGVFALFNQDQVYRALVAAVTFKTFAHTIFVPKLRDKTKLELGAHIGIDQKTVLVRKIGLRRHDGRSDRQNEVWAGKPVNMSSKLAAMADAGELWVSDRYFKRIPHERARKSCGCSGGKPAGEKVDLWTEIDLKG
jgi:class 3 adenylate cyclase